jgi:hypothetical protein
MARTADTVATTHKERKPPKIVSHLEIHPMMGGGHAVHTIHTHPYEHPPIVKKFEGEGHSGIMNHIGKQIGIDMAGSVGAGEDSEEAATEKKESAES